MRTVVDADGMTSNRALIDEIVREGARFERGTLIERDAPVAL